MESMGKKVHQGRERSAKRSTAEKVRSWVQQNTSQGITGLGQT